MRHLVGVELLGNGRSWVWATGIPQVYVVRASSYESSLDEAG